ncbi:MarR family winged helix-turn-helix transcriptional regulator [Kiloniella sp.]|uniref:MarR family winged helix-turn-helix transcriptional regulator n=1 Tax=Kiloniella sp. TaxID=1938587 RepID=UPI003B012055
MDKTPPSGPPKDPAKNPANSPANSNDPKSKTAPLDPQTRGLYFAFFNEIGIISQLSRAMMEASLPDGLSVAHFSVLNHLMRVGDGRTPLAIARAFQLPKTTMTHTLSVLEKNAMVELRPNPKDGRSKCVWLTEKGRKFRDDAIASLDPDVAALSSRIPLTIVSELVDKLADIRKTLDNYRDE